MSSQPDLFADPFDLKIGVLLKELGVKEAAEHRRELLELGKLYCERAARIRPDHTATADDAALGFAHAGLPADSLGNAAGALFRGARWMFTGEWRPSVRTTNHAHQNRVWKLKQ